MRISNGLCQISTQSSENKVMLYAEGNNSNICQNTRNIYSARVEVSQKPKAFKNNSHPIHPYACPWANEISSFLLY